MEDNDAIKVKRRRVHTDRATLNEESINKLKAWKQQIKEYYQDMIKVTYTDLVNRIINDYPEKLNLTILNEIQKDKLTDVKRAKWVYQRLLEAESKGEETSFMELIGKANGRSMAPRKRRRKIDKNEENSKI